MEEVKATSRILLLLLLLLTNVQGRRSSEELQLDSSCTHHGCLVCHPTDASSYGTCTHQFIKGRLVLMALWNNAPPSTSCRQEDTCKVSFSVKKQKRGKPFSSQQVDIIVDPQYSRETSLSSKSRNRWLYKQKMYSSQEPYEAITIDSTQTDVIHSLPREVKHTLSQLISLSEDVSSAEEDSTRSSRYSTGKRRYLAPQKSKYAYQSSSRDESPSDWAKKYYDTRRRKQSRENNPTKRLPVRRKPNFETNSQPAIPIEVFLSQERVSNSISYSVEDSSSFRRQSLTQNTDKSKSRRPKFRRRKPKLGQRKVESNEIQPSKHVVHKNVQELNQIRSCKLPKCFLPESGIPGGLPRSQTPMFVYFSFDDAVTPWTKKFFDKLFHKSRTNPNGCPISATHFNSHKNTIYKLVKQLYQAGHEIASHSISHRTPTTWWKEATKSQLAEEIVGQKRNIHKLAGVPMSEIRGMRAPFLQLAKDNQYDMLEENDFMYDASMSARTDPPSWPFTLHHPEKIVRGLCTVDPCPEQPHSIWEVPLNNFYMGSDCSSPMVDGCRPSTKDAALKYIRRNFQSHYNAPTKPPFGVNMHASWFAYGHNFQAMDEFVEELVANEDVWILPIYKVLQWMQNPTPASQLKHFKPFSCDR